MVFLTARDGTDDKIRGLTLGGDDYVTKPFSLEEVIARIKAVLRRTRGDGVEPTPRLKFADLELDEESHEVWRGGAQVQLSPTEFKLLRYFMSNANRVLSKMQILDHVWDYDFRGDTGHRGVLRVGAAAKDRHAGAPAYPHPARRRIRAAAPVVLMARAMVGADMAEGTDVTVSSETRKHRRSPWGAAKRLSDRTPLRTKLITAVLALVIMALAAISVASVFMLRGYVTTQHDNDLVSVVRHCQRHAPHPAAHHRRERRADPDQYCHRASASGQSAHLGAVQQPARRDGQPRPAAVTADDRPVDWADRR